jgi:hypothetical protein
MTLSVALIDDADRCSASTPQAQSALVFELAGIVCTRKGARIRQRLRRIS